MAQAIRFDVFEWYIWYLFPCHVKELYIYGFLVYVYTMDPIAFL